MLLNFALKNYKNFKGSQIFDMYVKADESHLGYSIRKTKIESKEYKVLCSSVIYGLNASGKSNLIGAMQVLQSIILRGHIRDVTDRTKPNIAMNYLGFIPNAHEKESLPIGFTIEFIENNRLYNYDLEFELGPFMGNVEEKRQILKEVLTINNERIFTREKKQVMLGEPFSFISEDVLKEKDLFMKMLQNNLSEKELFLMSGFKNLVNSKIVEEIRNWFEKKLVIIYRADAVETTKIIPNAEIGTAYVDRPINEAANIFGSSNDISYTINEENNRTIIISLVNDKAIPASLYESFGTMRFLNIFPIILSTMKEGATLVVDEFDASIHPMALINLVNIFHNDSLNINNAQLIFNTHNPIFLNSNIFRQDEIKFIEKDSETGKSEIYSLVDFEEHDLDYMNNYFINSTF